MVVLELALLERLVNRPEFSELTLGEADAEEELLEAGITEADETEADDEV